MPLDIITCKNHKNIQNYNTMAPWAKTIEEKYYIPEEWMYGQIIGKKGKTLNIIKDQAGLHHVYMDINQG